MSQEGSHEMVSLDRPSLRQISSYQPFSRFDCYLCTLVSAGVVSCGNPVDNAPPGAEVLHELGGEH